MLIGVSGANHDQQCRREARRPSLANQLAEGRHRHKSRLLLCLLRRIRALVDSRQGTTSN